MPRKKKDNSKNKPKKTKTTTPKSKKKKKTPTKPTKKKKVEKEEEPEEEEELTYEFTNYFTSEPKLSEITHLHPVEEILSALEKIVIAYATKHVRDYKVELEDLISEGKSGVLEAIAYFNNPKKKKKKYSFVQYCLYKIRERVYQYCLNNAGTIKTPYYIQRGLMHIGQIFKLMQNQSVAEKLLKRPGPASERDIINFIYDENERLPLKSERFIRQQINSSLSPVEKEQIYTGIMKHERGSKHSFIKKNLSDVGKCLHIKQKMFYTSSRNSMQYQRVIELTLSARTSQVVLDPAIHGGSVNTLDNTVLSRELMEHGAKVCGEEHFKIFLENKYFDKNYDDIAKKYNLKKSLITDIVRKCIKVLRKDTLLLEMFSQLQ